MSKEYKPDLESQAKKIKELQAKIDELEDEKQLREFPFAGTGIRVYEKINKYVPLGDEIDDDTGEIKHANIHSLGAGVVRVTGSIDGGDLLVSAGDGCAKQQDDDIVRTKTIGKVTANISGSAKNDRLIPCVFYCG